MIIHCHNCLRQVEAPLVLAGKTTLCPHCGTVLRVPNLVKRKRVLKKSRRIAILRRLTDSVFLGMRNGLIVLLCAAVISLVGWGIYAIYARVAYHNTFEPHLDEFSRIYESSITSEKTYPPSILDRPTRPKEIKVVAIEKEGNSFSTYYTGSVKSEFRAAVPSEATVLVVVTKEERDVGTYTDGTDAIQIFRKIDVFDIETGYHLEKNSVRGSAPPSQTKVDGRSESGNDPKSLANRWLNRLNWNAIYRSEHKD